MLDSQFIVRTAPLALPENQIIVGDWRITMLTSRLFRMELSETHQYCDEATQSVWFRDLPAVSFRLERGKASKIMTEDATLVIGNTLDTCYVVLDGKRIRLDNQANLLGTYRTLDRCDGDEYLLGGGKREKIHLENGVLSKNGVAVFDDSRSLILGTDGMLHARENNETDVYVFAYGHCYRDALVDLYRICGFTPMIPRYALGNWWSRYHAYSEEEYLTMLDRLKKRDIPITVATIDMDWHWSKTLEDKKKIIASGKNDAHHGCDGDPKLLGWSGYSWNTDLFPDYRSFLKKVQQRNLRITLNLHPASGVRYYEDQYEEMANAMGIDPKSEQVVPFDMTSADFINHYFKILHKPYEHDGVTFWWIDWQQGTESKLSGLDPLWALNHYHTLDNGVEHQPLILSRYCGIGSHRYPLGFSGDTLVTWNTMKFIPYFTVNASNAGYTWWSHDIGGHMQGIKDNELYVRFVQFGVFSPINRLHCSDSPLSTKEPLVYLNGAGRIAEEFLRLRHRMIPFLYSASYQTAKYGRALMEPMYYEYPEEKDAYRCKNQYLFGGQLLVAPITKHGDRKGMTATKVWLPKGAWTDIFTGDEYEGPKWIEAVRWTESIPVFAKEGGFFVLDGREHTNCIENPEMLVVQSYFGDGEYDLFEDDGDKHSCHTVFTSSAATVGDARQQTVTIRSSGDDGVAPAQRTIQLEFRNIMDGEVTVTEDGTPIDCKIEKDGFLSVIIPTQFGKQYAVIAVENAYDKKAKLLDRVVYSLLEIEGDNLKKGNLRKQLMVTDPTEWKDLISKQDFLTQNEKRRFFEEIS